MNEFIGPLTSGEIEKGAYVCIYETIEKKQPKSSNPLAGLFGQPEIISEDDNKLETNVFPLTKGMPMQVLSVAGFLLICDVSRADTNVGIMVVDTRYSKLMEVSEEYYNTYWEKLHKQKFKAPYRNEV